MVHVDAVPQQLRILRMTHDGKPAKDSEVREQERKINDGYRQGKGYFKLPFDPRHMATYTFSDGGSCDDCAPGTRVVRFKSALKDDQHGSGTMRLDARAHVVAFDFKPNKMPENANEGSMSFVRAEILPGAYGIRSFKGTFKGGVAFLRGDFAMEQRHEDFQRFKSLEEALDKQP
jgi:hypothetical protein